jgi:hypothetical protein
VSCSYYQNFFWSGQEKIKLKAEKIGCYEELVLYKAIMQEISK